MEWFLKCLEYIFEIVVNPNVSMVNSKLVQTKENSTLSQFVIFIGTVTVQLLFTYSGIGAIH